MIIRAATGDDVAAMSAVLVASITQLCRDDHGDDSKVVAGWTRNKTPLGVAAMLANPDTALFVAERDGAIAGVGAVMTDGAIGLNYVSPEHRFAGVSRALLEHMERVLAERGHGFGTLISTATARQMYQGAGWIDAGEPLAGFGTVGYPMRKVF